MKTTNASRRVFLRASSLLGALVPSAAPFALNLAAMGTAAAQSAPSSDEARRKTRRDALVDFMALLSGPT